MVMLLAGQFQPTDVSRLKVAQFAVADWATSEKAEGEFVGVARFFAARDDNPWQALVPSREKITVSLPPQLGLYPTDFEADLRVQEFFNIFHNKWVVTDMKWVEVNHSDFMKLRAGLLSENLLNRIGKKVDDWGVLSA